MKKFLTIFLVALLVLVSIPVSALAVKSPTLGEDLGLTAESSNPNAGTVTKTEIEDGVYKATANPSKGYIFDGWVIEGEGEYRILEGSLDSEDIVIEVISGNINLVANFKENLNAESSNSKAGTVTKSKPDDDGIYKVTANPSNGYGFDYWEVVGDGKYEILEGDLKSGVIRIKVTEGTIDLIAHFKKTGSGSDNNGNDGNGSGNNGNAGNGSGNSGNGGNGQSGNTKPGSSSMTSPYTGDSSVMVLLSVMMALVGLV